MTSKGAGVRLSLLALTAVSNIAFSIIIYLYLEQVVLVLNTIRILFVLELVLIGFTYISFYQTVTWLGKAFKKIRDTDDVPGQYFPNEIYPGWLEWAMERVGRDGGIYIMHAACWVYGLAIFGIVYWLFPAYEFREMEGLLAWLIPCNILALIAVLMILRTLAKTKKYIEWKQY